MLALVTFEPRLLLNNDEVYTIINYGQIMFLDFSPIELLQNFPDYSQG